MARFSRLAALRVILKTGLVPLFHHEDPDVVQEVVEAVADGGARVLEFTNRGDGAHETFAGLVRQCRRERPDLVLGAGSVTDPGTAAVYINHGADFVVGPSLNPEVAAVCNRRRVPYLPGCATPTEIGRAEELGCEIVKLFPGAAAGGPSFVKALLGPSPSSRLMPTGGVDLSEESLRSWFEAGVAAVGIGSKLISSDLVRARDWSTLTERVRRTLETVHELNAGVRESL